PAGPEGHASGPHEPRRRDRPRGGRRGGRAHRAAGSERSRRAYGRPLRPAHARARRSESRRDRGGGIAVLFGGNGRKDDLVLEGIRVVDPTQGIDEVLTITVEKGVIARLEPAPVGANGKVVAPAFIDPHVHLRTPGREDEEDIATGTRAPGA